MALENELQIVRAADPAGICTGPVESVWTEARVQSTTTANIGSYLASQKRGYAVCAFSYELEQVRRSGRAAPTWTRHPAQHRVG
jgi:hypothetical protein